MLGAQAVINLSIRRCWRADFSRMRLLLIEDDRMIAQSVYAALSRDRQ